MPLNISKGNMYDFITHTWNPIKGKCYHDCSYCYMKKWGPQKPVRLDELEFKTNLGENNFIFVGSSCDIFADNINDEWISRILYKCQNYNNKYFFQTKNPLRFLNFIDKYIDKYVKSDKSVFCTTIETNRMDYSIMGYTLSPSTRSYYTREIKEVIPVYITIEPILDFDLQKFINILLYAKPIQVNIGADSGNNKLPEPPKEKILELIFELKKFTNVHLKKNLNRLIK